MPKEPMKPAKKRASADGALVVGAPTPYERPKPSLSVTEKDLPAIKNWEVGKKYHVTAHVEMVRHSQGDEYGIGPGKKGQHEARLKIHAIKPVEEDK